MSSFNRIALTKYAGGNTIVHRIDPRVKLVFFLMYSFTLAMANRLSAVLVLGLIISAALPVSGLSVASQLRNLRGIFVFCVLLGGLQIFLQHGGRSLWTWGPLQVTERGLVTAAVFTLKILLFICLVTLLTRTTHPAKLMEGLRGLLSPLARIRVPVEDFVFMMTLAFTYIPFLAEEIDRIATAQKARGKQPSRWDPIGRLDNLLTMLVPIFSSTLRRAETMALALEARGYIGAKRIFPPIRHPLSPLDGMVIAASLLLPLIVFIFG